MPGAPEAKKAFDDLRLWKAVAHAFADLPGAIRVQISDSNADFFVSNLVAVVVEMDLSPVGKRYAGWLALPKTLLASEPAENLAEIVNGHLDRVFRPWKHADRPAIPSLELFPLVARVERRYRDVKASIELSPPVAAVRLRRLRRRLELDPRDGHR